MIFEIISTLLTSTDWMILYTIWCTQTIYNPSWKNLIKPSFTRIISSFNIFGTVYNFSSAPSCIKRTATLMIGKRLLSRLLILKLKHFVKFSSWCKKSMHIAFIVPGQREATSTRIRSLKLRKPTIFHPLTRVILEIKANQGML